MTVDPPSPDVRSDDDAALLEMLRSWLPEQRWFSGRQELTGGVVLDSRTSIGNDPTTDHPAAFEQWVIEIPGDGRPRRFQLWLGFRAELPDQLDHASIGELTDGTQVYDALHDRELTALMLTSLAAGSELGAIRCSKEPGIEIDASPPGLVLTGEQSNSSVIFGDSSILKVFRRLDPGPNPDVEVHRALAERKSAHAAPLLGELVGSVDGQGTTLAILTGFFAGSADGWLMATTSVRDLLAEGDLRADEVGGDFAAEARRLGESVAEVHADLAAVFGTDQISAAGVHEMVAEMSAAALQTAADIPELAAYTDLLAATFAEAADSVESLTLQRIHGDLHLGQTLRTLTGWAVIDFEGEPSKTIEYRRAKHSPLRDIAGMLRSFDYAAHHQLAGANPDAQHQYRSTEWAGRNREAFADGYASAAGVDPRKAGTLLRAFELDKAIYEVAYEHAYRPSWVPIPLQAVDQLSRSGGSS